MNNLTAGNNKNFIKCPKNFISTLTIKPLNNHLNIIQTRCLFNIDNYTDNLFEYYSVKKDSSINSAILKRKSEFLAGRVCALQGIRKLGYPAQNVLIGQHRNPIWPKGIIGSISHNKYTAISLVALNDQISALGIDVETILSPKLIFEIKSLIIDVEEENILLSQTLSYECVFSIVFSGKESVFKALYPKVKNYFDFDAVKLIAIDLNEKKIVFQLQKNLAAVYQTGFCIDVFFTILENEVTTWAILQ
jgi:4'-phosphopantetheinyl transferase EntD